MKKKILSIIYEEFARWASSEQFYCRKGCAVCCTENVTLTAQEGVAIMDFCLLNHDASWLAQKLSQKRSISPPSQTTNEYIASCIEGIEVDQEETDLSSSCPFLENDGCTIYSVRPFSCRCFVSREKCLQHGSALVPDYYLSASLAMMQLIEHLGQYEYWGNMTDVLLSLCDISSYRKILNNLDDPSRAMQARLQTLTAKPIPGFLFPEEDSKKITPLLTSIFTEKIGEKSVEQILNGQ